MDISVPQNAVMPLYEQLDAMQEVFKVMKNGFRVLMPGIGEVSLPPDKIEEVKAKYMALRSKIQSLANSIPDVVTLS